MPFANTSISDIIATTIQNRSGELADNVTNNNALLRKLKAKGNVRPFGGGNVILEEIMYAEAATIDAAVKAAAAALPAWRDAPPLRRARVMQKFLQLLQDHQKELAELLDEATEEPRRIPQER